jgi:hypothetical protein
MTRLVRLAAMMVPVLLVTACEKVVQTVAGGENGDGMKTTADTIALGRQVVMSSGCGDCHGGGSNPSAPNWLVGYRAGTEDTLFLYAYKMPAAFGGFQARPRNLTPDNETGLGRFTERQIFNALRYGLRPGETPDVEITGTTPGQGNYPESPKYLAPPMPWPAFRHKTDHELMAIAAYLKRGLKPQANKVEPSEGPPDFWTGLYTQFAAIGPTTMPAFPSEREVGPAAK